MLLKFTWITKIGQEITINFGNLLEINGSGFCMTQILVCGQWWNSGNVEYGYYNNTLDFVLSGNQTNWANPPWATLLIRKLVENNEFKNKFINRYADEMNSRPYRRS